MVDRSLITGKVLVVADRGYESFNNMAHCAEKGWSFIIRAKESYGIITKTIVPDIPTFDTSVTITLTRRQTKETKQLFKTEPSRFRWIPPHMTFDYLPHKAKTTYSLSLRVVRFETAPGAFETVYTNMPAEQFSVDELRNLYKLRWGIETSFRELKYAIGLASIHSKQNNSMLQEVYARLMLYNFTALIIGITKSISESRRLNFPAALLFCRKFLRKQLVESDLLQLITKHVTPIRRGRKFSRYQKHLSSMSLNYRIV